MGDDKWERVRKFVADMEMLIEEHNDTLTYLLEHPIIVAITESSIRSLNDDNEAWRSMDRVEGAISLAVANAWVIAKREEHQVARAIAVGEYPTESHSHELMAYLMEVVYEDHSEAGAGPRQDR